MHWSRCFHALTSNDSTGVIGTVQTVASLGVGASFGEMALWSETKTRTASAVTEGPCQVIEIPSSDYNLVIRSTQQKQLVDKVEFLKTVPCFGVRPCIRSGRCTLYS